MHIYLFIECGATEGCPDPDWDTLGCGSKKRGAQGLSSAAQRRRTSNVSFLSVSAASDEDEDEEAAAEAEGMPRQCPQEIS